MSKQKKRRMPVAAATTCSTVSVTLTVAGHENLFAQALVKAGLSMTQIAKVTRLYNASRPERGKIADLARTPGIKYTTLDAVARDGCHASVSRPMSSPNVERTDRANEESKK